MNFVRNILLKGLNTNIENTRYPSDSAWEILNARIYSTDGKNFVVRSVDGNQVKFALRSGYTLIGAKEYDDILYLASVNSDGILELGSYPSLAKQVPISSYNGYIRYAIGTGLDGFVNEYKPLPSILRSEDPGVLPQVYGFRTKSFNFSRDNFIVPLIKESYDGTVNIYLNDGEHFNRVVNSGFSKKDEEIKLERLYKGDVDSFPSIDRNVDKVTKQFLSINEPPYGKLKEVASGGNLPVGNLFFYIRYLDYEFNKTNFVPLIGPIMITYGDDIFSVSGNNPTGITNYANKNVTISMNYLDMAYKFFEIAIVWKTGTEPVGLGSRAMLLNKRIPVLQTSLDFNITGFEDMSEISDEEVLRPALKETICKVSTSLDGRMFGANWKEFSYDKDAMKELAKRCYVYPELVHRNSLIDLNGDNMKDYSMKDIDNDGPGEITKKYWYQQTEFVIDRVGHYRGEIYPFALVGVLEDGTHTEPYPITGYDFYDNGSFHPTENYLSNDANTNCGFVRFPQFGQCDLGDGVDDVNNILLARIGLGFFWNYIIANPNSFSGLKGFYITKGDRIKNLIYHGVTLRASEIFADSFMHYAFLGQFSTREVDIIGNKIAVSVPVPDTFPRIYTYSTPVLPVGKSKNGSIPIVIDYDSSDTDLLYGRVWSERDRHGVFSPDRLFSNIDKFVNSESLYCYFPYTQLPKFGLNSYSNYVTNSYVVPGTNSHFFSNRIYQMRYDYQEGFMGRMSINGNLVRGYFNNIQSTFHREYKTFGYWEKIDYAWPTTEVRVGLINDYYEESPYIPFIPSDLTKKNDYIKISGTNVLKDTFRSINNYSTKLGDGVFDNVDVGFYVKQGSPVIVYGNRDIRIPTYLGIDYTDDESSYLKTLFNDATMMPITLYREKNDAEYYNKIVNRYLIGDTYQLSEINYKISTPFIPIVKESRVWSLNEINASNKSFNWVYSNGDCFMSRMTFRQMYNGKTFDIYNSESTVVHNTDGKHYNHGRIFSVVLQSDVNTGVRGQGALGFYPLWASDWKRFTSSDNYNSMLCSRFGGSGGVDGEDFIYDWGHSQTLPFNIVTGINDIYKNRNTEYITRVRYTDKHQEVAFVDGWRSMYYLSKADYPIEYGQIFGLGIIGASLVIATPDSVQQLFVNEKAITQSQQGGNVIVGAGSILYGESKKISDLGTQHKHIITTENGVYGYDYKRSTFWRVMASYTTSGGVVLGVRPVSNDISSFLKNRMVDDQSLKSIAYGYDEKEKEVLVTVKHKIRLSVNQFSIAQNGDVTIQLPSNYNDYDWCGYVEVERNGRLSNVRIIDLYENTVTLSSFDVSGTIVLLLNKGFTLSYNEKLSSTENDFITRLGISPDIYSCHKMAVMSLNRDVSYQDIYSHDNKLQKHTFYGFNSWFKYGIVTTNNSSESKATYIQAIFYNFIVTSDAEPFDVVDYETEFQKCRHYPFIDNVRFWVTPEYAENRWMFTIPETNIGTGQYEAESNIRGIWLKTLLIYKGEKEKYIGEIINKNVLSFT